MIIITGASGFIGSAVASRFNDLGRGFDLIVVDDFYKDYKDNNLNGKIIRDWIHRDIFLPWLKNSAGNISFVIHLGARTDTTEQSTEIFDRLNLEYSKHIWRICTELDIPLIYASSAATYGDGKLGFNDEDEMTPKYTALNPYGKSKLEFDQWALQQESGPPRWYGLRFFNVFGPNEYHKGRMASVVLHAFRQIKASGKMKLFRSHREDYEDGEQRRDFIYVKDVVDVIVQLYTDESLPSGIYNLGTGKSRTFVDLVRAVFSALKMEENIEFIDTPEDIRESYQYFTEAVLEKGRASGISYNFKSLEDSVTDYVRNYLIQGEKNL